MTFLKRDSPVCNQSRDGRLELQVNQYQPIGNVAFVEGLTPLFNGRRNICSHRSRFNKKSLEKVLLSSWQIKGDKPSVWNLTQGQMICLAMMVVKV